MHSHPHSPPRAATPARRLSPALLAGFATTLLAALLAACGGGGELQVGVSTPQVSLTPPAPTDALNLCGNATTVGDVLAKINARRSQAQDCGTRGSFAAATPLAGSTP